MAVTAKLIAVIGATGNQGGSVVRSLLRNRDFKVRGITRNSKSDVSMLLALSGADIVQADGFHSEEMFTALEGAWGAFINLNSNDKSLEISDGPNEFDLGRKIVDAAIRAGVKHLVFSSGPPCTEMTKGQVSLRAMDMKYRIEQYAKEQGKFKTVTPICAAWYLENFLDEKVAPALGGFPHVLDDEGYLTFRVPNWGGDDQVPFVSIGEDYGDIVHGIFLDPERWNDHLVQGVSNICGFDKMVADFEKGAFSFSSLTGKKARFKPILPSWEAFDTHGFHELEEVKLMFGFTQITGGSYFGRVPNEIGTAAALKRATTVALGLPEEQQSLITIEQWFRSRFVL